MSEDGLLVLPANCVAVRDEFYTGTQYTLFSTLMFKSGRMKISINLIFVLFENAINCMTFSRDFFAPGAYTFYHTFLTEITRGLD